MDDLRDEARRATTRRLLAATSAAAVVALLLPGSAVANQGRGVPQQVDEQAEQVALLEEQLVMIEQQIEELDGVDADLAGRLGSLEESQGVQDDLLATLTSGAASLEASQVEQDARLDEVDVRLDDLVAAIGEAREERFPVIAVGGPGPLAGLLGEDDGLTWVTTETADGLPLPGRYEITLDGREDEPTGCFVVEVHESGAEEISFGTFEEVDGTDVTYGWRLQLLDSGTGVGGEGKRIFAPVYHTDNPDSVGTADVSFTDRYTTLVETGDGSAGFLLVVRETPGTAACIERERF